MKHVLLFLYITYFLFEFALQMYDAGVGSVLWSWWSHHSPMAGVASVCRPTSWPGPKPSRKSLNWLSAPSRIPEKIRLTHTHTHYSTSHTPLLKTHRRCQMQCIVKGTICNFVCNSDVQGLNCCRSSSKHGRVLFITFRLMELFRSGII